MQNLWVVVRFSKKDAKTWAIFGPFASSDEAVLYGDNNITMRADSDGEFYGWQALPLTQR